MKNVILLLLFILALSSCTIEKRRYFKGYHVENGRMGKWENGKESHSTGSGTAHSTGSGTSPRNVSPVARHEGEQETSEAPKPQRGEIVLDDIAMDDIAKIDEAPKPQRGDIVLEDIAIKSHKSVTTANAHLPVQYAGQARGHKKSHALEGLGTIFFLGIITLVVIVALLLFILTDSAVFAVIGSLILGLFLAIGVYLLLMILFFALLFLIINSFGS